MNEKNIYVKFLKDVLESIVIFKVKAMPLCFKFEKTNSTKHFVPCLSNQELRWLNLFLCNC